MGHASHVSLSVFIGIRLDAIKESERPVLGKYRVSKVHVSIQVLALSADRKVKELPLYVFQKSFHEE